MVQDNSTKKLNQQEFNQALLDSHQIHVIDGDLTYNRGAYDYYIVTPEGRSFDVSSLVASYSYSFAFNEPHATIEIELAHPTMIGQLLTPGNWIVIYGPYWNNSDIPNYTEFGPSINPEKITGPGMGLYQEIERAQITTVRKGVGDRSMARLIAKTPEWLLEKNTLPYRLPKGTVKDRLKFVAEVTGMNFQDLVGPNPEHVLPSTRGGRDSIWSDIMLDLGETNRVEGKRYVLRQRRGQFYLQEISTQERMWLFEVGANIFEMEVESSIEEYYNVIYVLSNADSMLNEFLGLVEEGSEATSLKMDYTGLAINEAEYSKFGQHILVVDEKTTTDLPTAQAQADFLLSKYNKIQQSAALTSYNLNGIRWGDQILIAEPSNELYGIFFVRGGRNMVTAGRAVMDLDISFEKVAPEAVRDAAQDQLSNIWDNLGVTPEMLENATDEFVTAE